MSNVKSVDDADFASEVLNSDKPVLVEFGAEWCGPCKRLAPILDEYAHKNETVKVLKVDVDDAPSTAAKFGIRGVPTLMVFKNGQSVGTKVGLIGLSAMEVFVSDSVNK